MMNSASVELNDTPAAVGAAGDVAISIRGLDVRRGRNLVLPGLSLDIKRGVVTGLLGPSGSGKSTLMRAVVGVQTIAGGTVTVLGEPAGGASLRRRVGYVTQAPSVYGDLTVRENLAYFARVLGVPGARIAEVVELVSLGDQGGRVVGTLSGGERSRTSLAVALLGDPELLVLDEPTVGLDPVLREDLWQTFRALTARGTTLLVSTHVMDEAQHCDELVLLRAGRIVAAGTPRGLLEQTGADDVEHAFIALARAAA
ncbi:MAG: type transport system ATP-binding protein [Solirubrobacteraceae bacterium]|nr:type transport system ATP-binding protein [Solirubrobacteraceae bacterium]